MKFIRTKRPDGGSVKFTYDPLARRMSKSFNGKITKWIWDGNVILHEWVEHFENVNDESEIPIVYKVKKQMQHRFKHNLTDDHQMVLR